MDEEQPGMSGVELLALTFQALDAYHELPEDERPELSAHIEQWFSEIPIDPFAVQVTDGKLAD